MADSLQGPISGQTLPLDKQAPPMTGDVSPEDVLAALVARRAAPPAPTPATGMTPEMAALLPQASQTGMSAFKQMQPQMQSTVEQSESLASAPWQTPEPKYGPQVEPGAGFMHNLGQVLLMALGTTRPGAAVNEAIYGPKIRAREVERKTRAEEISSLQEGAKTTEGALAPAAGMVYHPFQAGAELTRAEAAAKNADTRAAALIEDQRKNLATEAQGWQRLTQEAQGLQIRQKFNDVMEQIYRERISAGMEENDARVAAQKDAVAVMQSNEIVQKNPVWSQIMAGLGIAPTIQVPTGTSTEPTKPGQAGAKAGTTRIVVKGRAYNIPNDQVAQFKKEKGLK